PLPAFASLLSLHDALPISSTSQGSRPGLGLGLAIVRGMVEAMGGSVSASPSPLGGLRITVELPAAGTAPGEPATPTGGPAAATQDRKSTRLNSSHEWISYA